MKTEKSNIFSASIITIIILVLLSSCSHDKRKPVKRSKNISSTAVYPSLADSNLSDISGGLNTDGSKFISFIDGNSVYVAMPDGTKVTKIYNAQFPKGTYFHYIDVKEGKDFILISTSFYMTNDLEHDVPQEIFAIVNIHTGKVTAQASTMSANEGNMQFIFRGAFINGTNKIIYDDNSDKLNIYNIEDSKVISYPHSKIGIVSPDQQKVYFENISEFDESPSRPVLNKKCDIVEYSLKDKKIVRKSEEGGGCDSIVTALSKDGTMIAYVRTNMKNSAQQLTIKNTLTFNTIKQTSINVPVAESYDEFKLYYQIKQIIFSPSNNKIAYVAKADIPIPRNDRYFEVIEVKDGRIIQKKTIVEDETEEIEWVNDKYIKLKKWNMKFNKDKGKKEKPYIERTINIAE